MGKLGDLSPQGSVAVGVFVGLISTSVQAIGLTLQRKSHILEDEKDPYEIRRPPYKRRRWQLGMLMFVVSNIVGSTIQITTLPLPVLSTLQASGLVFNTIFATVILGEAFTRFSLLGTILVCIGAILIATFGAIGEPPHTLDQLLLLLQRHPFILWVAGTVILMLGILAGSRMLRLLSSSPRWRHSSARRLQVVHSRIRLIRGMCFGLVSGILSAHTLLLAKSAVELLVRTIVYRTNQFNRWQSWIILIGVIALALSQLFFLHRGLKLCSTSVLYPFVFCIYNIIAILDGLIYFRQVSDLGGLHAGLIALGTVILLNGVLCLSWRLEDIDNHAAVTVVGSSQTGLGPGMAVMEENHLHGLGLDGEEGQPGERQPLLQAAPPQRRSTHRRTPSLPSSFAPTQHRPSAPDLDSASIWAELDDSEYPGSPSSPFYRPTNTIPARPRSKSGTYATLRNGVLRRSQRSTTNPILNYRNWDPRRIPPSVREGKSQQRSPASESASSTLKSQTQWESNGVNASYGTQDARNDQLFRGSQQPSPEQQPDPNNEPAPRVRFLAGPRNPLANAWRTGARFLSRWTGQRQQLGNDRERSPEIGRAHV